MPRSPDGAFDTATTVVPTGSGSYTAQVDPAWSIGSAPNGGYLLSLAQRALADALPLPHPLTITGHFLASPSSGPITIDVVPLRLGRTLARAEARLRQDGREFLRALAAFGKLPADDSSPVLYGVPPDLPPKDDCPAMQPTTPDGRAAPLRDQFEVRYHPGALGWHRGAPSGRAEISAWVRLRDGREPDAHLCTLVVDSLPSAAFDLGLLGWIPTVELSVHHRSPVAPGWLRCRLRSRFVSHGLVEEDGEIWDDKDRLVAMSRQLSLVPASTDSPPTPSNGRTS